MVIIYFYIFLIQISIKFKFLIKYIEINFNLLAIVPVFIFAGLVTYAIRLFFFGGRSRNEDIYAKMKILLRKTEKVLIHSYEQQELNSYDAGNILLYTHLIRNYAVDTLNNKQRKLLQHDLKRLRSVHFTPAQKLRVIESMNRSFSFLNSTQSMI